MLWPTLVAGFLLAQEATIPALVLKPIPVGVVYFQDQGSQGVVLPEEQVTQMLLEKVDTTRFRIFYAPSPDQLPQNLRIRITGQYRLSGGKLNGTFTFLDIPSGQEKRFNLTEIPFADAQQALAESLSTYSLSLVVSSDPPGGQVFVDGVPAGTTPVEIQNLAPGTYTIAVQLQNARKETTITLHKFMLLALKLPEEAAAPPPQASESLPPAKLYTDKSLVCEVWIDGKKVGYTNEGPFDLSPGKHIVRCVHPFYGAKEWVIEAKPNEEIHLRYFEE